MFPKLTTSYPVEEAVYNMSIDECINAVEPDGTLRTGLEWGGVWTRDVSYSTILSMAFMQPHAAMTSLLCKINSKGEIVQDTGTGGAWPCSTDRQVWVAAAWELYKVTGDRKWLETVYPVAKKSLEVDLRTVYDDETGLVKGESSFIDWRKQSYPLWMESADIYDSKYLGTNVVHYMALNSAAQMARLLGDELTADNFYKAASGIKDAINGRLWMEDKGYYANAKGSLYSDQTCGIRMLYVDGKKAGICVFPNRHFASGSAGAYATDGWDMWGWTSPQKLGLSAGKHTLKLVCESDSDNMKRTTNDFMLKGLKIVCQDE